MRLVLLVALALAFAPTAAAEYVDAKELVEEVVGPDPPGQGCRPTCYDEGDEPPPSDPSSGPGP